jgi:branched-chain amino acid transport system permease protein
LLAAFALTPLVAPTFSARGPRPEDRAFATLVASYDVVIGYTGIVSFGHAMYSASGVRGSPRHRSSLGADLRASPRRVCGGIGCSAVVAVVIGAFSPGSRRSSSR